MLLLSFKINKTCFLNLSVIVVVVLPSAFHIEAFLLTKSLSPFFFNRKLPMIFVACAHGG